MAEAVDTLGDSSERSSQIFGLLALFIVRQCKWHKPPKTLWRPSPDSHLPRVVLMKEFGWLSRWSTIETGDLDKTFLLTGFAV